MNVDGNGNITLIHGGTPECYYHAYGVDSENSVSILAPESTSSNVGTSKAWTKYGNSTYATSVRYMKIEDITTITGKSDPYTDCNGNACDSYEMVNINSYYWLASQVDSSALYFWGAIGRDVGTWDNGSIGVRPVVVLKSGVKLGSGTGTASEPYNLII